MPQKIPSSSPAMSWINRIVVVLLSAIIFIALLLLLLYNVSKMMRVAGGMEMLCDCFPCRTDLSDADFFFRHGLMVGVALSSLAMHVWALIRSKPQNWIVSLLCFLFVLFMTLQCDMGRYCDHFHKG